MKSTPSSGRRLRTSVAASTSGGRPQMPSPVMRMAPKPRRVTSSSPPMRKGPDSVAVAVIRAAYPLRLDSLRMATEERQFTERDVPFTTLSGEPIRALYTEADLPADTDAAIGLPGEFPLTRGVSPTIYRG